MAPIELWRMIAILAVILVLTAPGMIVLAASMVSSWRGKKPVSGTQVVVMAIVMVGVCGSTLLAALVAYEGVCGIPTSREALRAFVHDVVVPDLVAAMKEEGKRSLFDLLD